MTDVIVVGLGADGSAAAAHLAAREQTVTGIEAFARGNTLGSSGGLTRVIRLAYYEHPAMSPLLRRAWVLWRELEKAVSQELLRQVGGVCIGPREDRLVSGSRRSAVEHGLAHELLDPAGLRDRLPLFQLDPEWWGVAGRTPASSSPSAASRRISTWRSGTAPRCVSTSRSGGSARTAPAL